MGHDMNMYCMTYDVFSGTTPSTMSVHFPWFPDHPCMTMTFFLFPFVFEDDVRRAVRCRGAVVVAWVSVLRASEGGDLVGLCRRDSMGWVFHFLVWNVFYLILEAECMPSKSIQKCPLPAWRSYQHLSTYGGVGQLHSGLVTINW